jgi:hypothetical protein
VCLLLFQVLRVHQLCVDMLVITSFVIVSTYIQNRMWNMFLLFFKTASNITHPFLINPSCYYYMFEQCAWSEDIQGQPSLSTLFTMRSAGQILMKFSMDVNGIGGYPKLVPFNCLQSVMSILVAAWAAWLLGSRVRIPLRSWMFVFLCLYVVLSCVGRGLCDGLITRPKESYQVSKTNYKTSRVRRPRSLQGP